MPVFFEYNQKKIDNITPHLGKNYAPVEFECTRAKFKTGVQSTMIEITLNSDAIDNNEFSFLKNLMKNTFNKEDIDFKIIT